MFGGAERGFGLLVMPDAVAQSLGTIPIVGYAAGDDDGDDDDGSSIAVAPFVLPKTPGTSATAALASEDVFASSASAALDDDSTMVAAAWPMPSWSTPRFLDDESAVIPVFDVEHPTLPRPFASPPPANATLVADDDAAVVPVFDHDGPYATLRPVAPMSYAVASSVDEEFEPAVVTTLAGDEPDVATTWRVAAAWYWPIAVVDEELATFVAPIVPPGSPPGVSPPPVVPLGRVRAILAATGDLRASIAIVGELRSAVVATGELGAAIMPVGEMCAVTSPSGELDAAVMVIGDLKGVLG